MSYSSFDYLFVGTSGGLRNLLAQVGGSALVDCYRGVIGVGMMTKYTMAFLVLGVAGDLLLTPNRRYLKSPWTLVWCGGCQLAHAAQYRLANAASGCLTRVDEDDSRTRIARAWTNYFLVNQFWRAPESSQVRYGARAFGTGLQPLKASATACWAGCS